MLQQRKRLIAAQLGIAPETLSRVLRHLRERSLISGSGRVVNLVDLNALRLLVGESCPRHSVAHPSLHATVTTRCCAGDA